MVPWYFEFEGGGWGRAYINNEWGKKGKKGLGYSVLGGDWVGGGERISPNPRIYSFITLQILRLLASKAQERKDFLENHLYPVRLVFNG